MKVEEINQLGSLIKSSLLRNLDAMEEYLINAAGQSVAQRRHRSRKNVSPEDMAAKIILQAEEQAKDIINASRQEAEQIRSAAFNEGYESGQRQLEAEKQALDETAALMEADICRRIEEFWTTIEPQLLKLSVEIARKIIRHELDENKEFIMTIIKDGLRQLRDRQDIRVRVNPKDYQLVREHKDDISGCCDGIRNIEVIDDRRVDPGGCIIETGNGHLDARIETQLKEIEKALTEVEHAGVEVTPEP